MVRHKQNTKPTSSSHKPNAKTVTSNDIAKLKFKPGQFIVVNKSKTYTIPNNSIEMALKEKTITMPSTSSMGIDLTTEEVINVPTSNKYQALENQVDMEQDNNKSTSSVGGTAKQRTVKPPPIVIHHKIPNHSTFIQELQNEVKNGFHIKNSRYNTNVFINDPNDYHKYLELLEKNKEDFHTYTEKNKKTHAFVLKGIDSDPTTVEIQQDIEEKYSLKIQNIYKLKNTTRNIYLIITDNSIYLRFLVANVKYVCHTKITWERHINRSPVLQCRRCQKWGHATNNCRSQPTCTKCADQHWTKECTKVDKENKETHQHIKCANCQGSHLAFSKDCPAYQTKVKDIERRKTNSSKPVLRKPSFMPAPMPTTNPWLNRMKPREARNMPLAPPPNVRNNYVSSVISQEFTGPSPQKSDHQTNFSSLIGEFNVLNQLIDLERMVRLVRELNSQLRSCKDEMEKFFILNQFCQFHFKANETTTNQWRP